MKQSLPSLAAFAAFAWAAVGWAQQAPRPAAGDASSVSAEGLVDRVLAAAEAHDSISAKVRHRVELAERPALLGTGDYVQQGRGAGKAFRLELVLRTALSATRVEHVCDGSQLWTLEELDGQKNATVVDIGRIARARPRSRPSTQPPPQSLPALGGLPKLLTGLQESFTFNRVTESQLDELRVWSIEGGWNPGKLAELLPDQKQAIETGGDVELGPLAANLPHRVVLHVGCDDLFPYRIEYWRIDPKGNNGDGPRQARLIVVMELYEVRFNAAIDPGQFVFRGGETRPRDRTKELLDQFGLEDPPPEEAKRVLRSQL